MGQDAQRELFDLVWNLPCPQTTHRAYPSSLYFPGEHIPEHSGVVAPEVLLNVPPRQILHASNAVAPCVAPHRPAGQRLRSKTTENGRVCEK